MNDQVYLLNPYLTRIWEKVNFLSISSQNIYISMMLEKLTEFVKLARRKFKNNL